MSWLTIENLGKRYELEDLSVQALDAVNLDVAEGEFIVIVGRSGSGKTTLLRILAGLETQTEGAIRFVGKDVGEAFQLPVGMVFQEARLLPWLSVENNILFPYLPGGRANALHAKGMDILRMLGLEDYANAMPAQLSGGMAQRVALGRALSSDPKIVLLDEPLGALDYFTRAILQRELVRIHHEGKQTFMMVTHDVGEAVLLATRVIVLREGRMVLSLPVPLDYPRTRKSMEFQELVAQILEAIGSEEEEGVAP